MEILLEKLLLEKNLIKLDTNQYVILKNSKLKNAIILLWLYPSEELILTRVSPDVEKDFSNGLIIQDEHYLLLNPDDEGYERALRLTVNGEKDTIDIAEVLAPALTQGKFKIIYNL